MAKTPEAAVGAPATTDVHEALRRAVDRDRARLPMQNCNFKADPLTQELAEAICTKEGTTLSAFLRECLGALVRDYVGPKAAARLDESAQEPG